MVRSCAGSHSRRGSKASRGRTGSRSKVDQSRSGSRESIRSKLGRRVKSPERRSHSDNVLGEGRSGDMAEHVKVENVEEEDPSTSRPVKSSRRRGSARSRNGSRSRSGPSRRRRQRLSVNPFMNFLSALRGKVTGFNALQLASEGGRLWRGMSAEEKRPFLRAACKAQRLRRAEIKLEGNTILRRDMN